MANNGNGRRGDSGQKSKFSFLKYLAFVPEARVNQPPQYPSVGRFKFFRAVHKTYSSYIYSLSLLAALFFLPALFAYSFPHMYGLENFGYAVSKVLRPPYLMSELGFGLSSGGSYIDAELNILFGRKVQLTAIGLFLPIGGIGFAGLYNVINKMMWGDAFTKYKTDKVGNTVPCVFYEFFAGIKKYWLPMIIIMLVVGGMFIGTSFAIVNLIEKTVLATAGAGDYIGAIVACIIALYVWLTALTMLPMTVQYKENPITVKLRNASIFDISMILPLAMIALITALIFWLGTAGGFFMIIVLIFIFILGISYFVMTTTNFSHYLAEKIVTPMYEYQQARTMRREKKKKKK